MSKGLEAQDIIIDMFNKYANKPNDEGEFFKFCNADEVVKKELEALDIIKKKNVDIQYFRKCKTVTDYNRYYYTHEKIAGSEFNLLKEVLNNE